MVALSAKVDALANEVSGLPSIDADDIAEQVVDALADRVTDAFISNVEGITD